MHDTPTIINVTFIIHALTVFCAPNWLVVFFIIEYDSALKKGSTSITIKSSNEA
jgi:hypothetical protein